jgi:hypothetical protein
MLVKTPKAQIKFHSAEADREIFQTAFRPTLAKHGSATHLFRAAFIPHKPQFH